MMLCVTHSGKISELNGWARDAITAEAEASTALTAWTPSEERWPKDSRLKVSKIFVPLVIAHREFAWPADVLDSIGLAMQAWRGEWRSAGRTSTRLTARSCARR